MKPCWLWPLTALSFRYFSISPRIIFSITLPGTSETDRPAVSRVPFLTLLENWDIFQLSVGREFSRFPRLLLPGRVSQEQSRGITSFDLLATFLLMQPRILSASQAASIPYCWFTSSVHQRSPQVFLHRETLLCLYYAI